MLLRLNKHGESVLSLIMLQSYAIFIEWSLQMWEYFYLSSWMLEMVQVDSQLTSPKLEILKNVLELCL